MRVYELAKELNIPSKELLGILKDVGSSIKSHNSSLDDDTVEKVKKKFLKKEKPKKAKTVKKEKKVKIPKKVIKAEEIEKKEEPVAPPEVEKVKEEKKEEAEEEIRIVEIDEESISIRNLAEKLGIKLSDLMKVLLKKGLVLNLNSEIDKPTAKEIALEFKIVLDFKTKETREEVSRRFFDEEELLGDLSKLKPRPPVVTIMGHVDHGKTRLLDTIRKTNVIDSEAGGITQHIGAYQVIVNDKKVTFLDTPGHEAFTTLRARGAQVTDIAVLVVAADDGVMPQTIEAIDHAKAAGVPIVVAINKIDKPDANIDRVKQQLSDLELLSEDWGGKTVMVPISAKFGQGVEDLLEMILLTSEVQELKANPRGKAMGIIIEAKLTKEKGPVATVLVKKGELHIGEPFIIGDIYGKVRALLDYNGHKVKSAGPSMPVEVLGISEVPQSGEIFEVKENEKEARSIALNRVQERKDLSRRRVKQVSLENLSEQIKEGKIKELKLIIKADVQGSLEAIVSSLERLSLEDITVNLIHSATGQINESDIILGKASQAIVIGFGVGIIPEAKKLADDEGVDVRLYNIIYKAIDDVKAALEGMLEPEFEEVNIGKVEVRQLFKYSKVGIIAGCYVTSGVVKRNSQVRVKRGKDVLVTSKIESLKRFKEDVREVKEGFECGIVIEKFDDLKQGDILELFELKKIEEARIK